MPRIITATEARVHLGAVLREVEERGEPIIVSRDGQPRAVILSLAEFQRLDRGARREAVLHALDEATELAASIAARRGGEPLLPVDDVIRDMREERSQELDRLCRR